MELLSLLFQTLPKFRNMDFTDIIKFFNEMAERHDEEEILGTARDMVCRMTRISAEED